MTAKDTDTSIENVAEREVVPLSPAGDGSSLARRSSWSDEKEPSRSRLARRKTDGQVRLPKKSLEVRPVLAVGVGGTGCLAVKHLKKRVLEVTRGVSVPFIRYVVFDTTVEEPSVLKLDEGEFVNIGHLDFNEIVEHISDYPYLKTWFPHDKFKPMQLGLGAMGVRHIGRLCYFQWRESSRIRDLLLNRFQELMNPSLPDMVREFGGFSDVRLNQSTGIDIHIIGSGSGGTGSGVFLDLAYDLRQWAKSVARSARIYGHLLLPDAFEGLVPEPVLPQAENNSYALLSEIDHFLGHGGWNVGYKGEHVTTRETPFDLIYLLGRNGMDGAARTRRDLVAMIGNVIASLCLTPTGKDLMDCAVNLIPPVLSGTDDDYQKPCPYSSYGISVGMADREEISRNGVRTVEHKTLDRLLGEGEGTVRVAEHRADAFLDDISLSVEALDQLQPDPPAFTISLQPGNVADADVFRESQHLPKLHESAAHQERDWRSALEERFGAAGGKRLLSQLKQMLVPRAESVVEPLRLDDLVSFVRVLGARLKEIASWCNAKLEALAHDAEEASEELQELRLSTNPPEDWLPAYVELAEREDRCTFQGDFYRAARELALKTASGIQSGALGSLEDLQDLLRGLRRRVDQTAQEPEEYQVPQYRLVSSREVLHDLYENLGETESSFRRHLAAQIEDTGARDPSEIALRSLEAKLEALATDAVETALVTFSRGNRLDLQRIAEEIERREPELLRLKLKNMYSLAQPAFRTREKFPKEKIVTTGRITAESSSAAARLVRSIDATVQSIVEDSSEVTLFRFIYGLPLWAIEGMERWERAAIEYQSSQHTLHNYLDPEWTERISPVIPKPVTVQENLWYFTMSFLLGRIAKPVETYEIDGEKLRGVKDRLSAFREFERRLEDGRIPRPEIEDQVEGYLRQQGDHRGQLEALERHVASLQARLNKEHGAVGAKDDVKMLREEVAIVKDHIARKELDL